GLALAATAHVREQLHVGAGAEAAPGAGDDDHPRGVILGRSQGGILDLLGHAGGRGIELVGAVEGDPRHPVLYLVENLPVAHGVLLWFGKGRGQPSSMKVLSSWWAMGIGGGSITPVSGSPR